MNSGKVFAIGLAISLILAGGQVFGQTADEQLAKAIKLEEVKGELEEAIEEYQTIITRFPENRPIAAKALLHQGMCYEKMGLKQAKDLYDTVINKYSEQSEEVALAKKRVLQLAAYHADINKEAEQHLNEGNKLYNLWEYESAIREYENVIKIAPNTLLAQNAQYCTGQCLFRAGKYDSALATFKKLIDENPESNIAPVAKLMIEQVNYTIANNKSQAVPQIKGDDNVIIDPKTGIKFTKLKSFYGRNDKIEYTGGGLNLSPDDRFMVWENMVVPIDGSEAFELVGMKALRSVYSPDMSKAAFYADSAIWVVPVTPETGRSAGSPVKILDGKYRYQYKVGWSPDGEKLAFQRFDKEFAGSIWTISVSNGLLTSVTDDANQGRCPAWSPDGNTIAYWKNKEVWISTADGGEAKKIINFGGYPTWSPNGKWLYNSNWEINKLFCVSDNQNYDFFTPVEVGGFIAFSSEGKKMLFYRPSYDYKSGFRVVASSGGPSFELGRDLTVYTIRWSPDSKVILAQGQGDPRDPRDMIFRILPLGGGESYMINIDVNVNGKPFPFDVSRDQKKLAFTIARDDGSKDLYVVPVSVKDGQTTGPAELVFESWSMRAYNVDFSWSKDGTNVTLIHNDNIWIVPLSGGQPTQITNTPEGKTWISLSPDGKKVSYFTGTNTKSSLNVIPVSGGNSIMVMDDCKTAAWSPNSKEFAISSGGKISIISLDGYELRNIFNQNDLDLDDVTAPVWSPDGKYLAFTCSNSEADYRLFMVPSVGGKVTELAAEDKEMKYGVNWSPDGKWIGYLTARFTKARPEGILWEADFEEVIEKLVK